jgi:hypothetical protein
LGCEPAAYAVACGGAGNCSSCAGSDAVEGVLHCYVTKCNIV